MSVISDCVTYLCKEGEEGVLLRCGPESRWNRQIITRTRTSQSVRDIHVIDNQQGVWNSAGGEDLLGCTGCDTLVSLITRPERTFSFQPDKHALVCLYMKSFGSATSHCLCWGDSFVLDHKLDWEALESQDLFTWTHPNTLQHRCLHVLKLFMTKNKGLVHTDC